MQENIDKIKEKIQEYQNKDVYIELENAISYHFLICNAKLLVSQEMLFITDEKKRKFFVRITFFRRCRYKQQYNIFRDVK